MSLLPKTATIAQTRQKYITFSANAQRVLEKRYLRHGADGLPSETAEQMFARISQALAQPDRKYGRYDETELIFYNLLSQRRFFPNSPTFTGAGTPLGQLAACFVLPVDDDMGRKSQGIFSTLRVAALIQQTGGGNGFSFSRLRPKGSLVKTSMGKASGPIGFLSIYDSAFGVVAQGGVRRGANMAVLRVDHPDIEGFIKCKAEEGTISNFNISVAITDKFMQAVENDGIFELLNPTDGQVFRQVKARELFDKIINYAYKNGEPGCLFIDRANQTNPVPHLYELEATNPCGEQWLGPYENCCLGSINLNEHVIFQNGQSLIDWEKLRETVVVSTHFLDNVVTVNKYVPEVPELEQAALNVRRIGLGFMGLSDLMYKLRVRYGSPQGIELAAQISEFMRYHSLKTSTALASERGPFLKIKGSVYDKDNFRFEAPPPLTPYQHDFKRPDLDWEGLISDIKKFGVRNGAQTTVAPTGTISTVAGIEGYGCEPVFALAYVRNVYQAAMDEGNMSLTYVSPLFGEALDEAGIVGEAREKTIKEVIQKGSCQHLNELPAWIKNTFVVSSDITPNEHVNTQAAIQRFIDNSISKTCNFPETATTEDVKAAYFLAWKLGCKGLTVYVTGSRQEVVLETKETRDKKLKQETDAAPNLPLTTSVLKTNEVLIKDRPYKLSGSTYKVQTPQGRAYITINRNGHNLPFETFLTVGKAGSDTAALSETIGRLISGWLRSSSDPQTACLEIIEQLSGIGGRSSIGFGNKRISSLADAIAKVLKEDLGLSPSNSTEEPIDSTIIQATQIGTNAQADLNSETSMVNGLPAEALAKEGQRSNVSSVSKLGDLCPECGNSSLVNEEGCRKCYACAYSQC